jgi:hypothetical protein
MKIATMNPDGAKDWQIIKPDANLWIWLDEKKVRHCVAADDVAGVVWVGPGRFEGDDFVFERRTGKVEIRLHQPSIQIDNCITED